VQDAQAYADVERVLTKKIFMFIIHRITIQRYIGYNLGFGPFLFDTAVSAGQRYFSWQLPVDEIPEKRFLMGRY